MKRFFLHVVLTIVIGGIIYILYRSDDLLMFRWFEFLKIDKVIYSVREYSYSHRRYIPESILYSLSDSLWVYSFTMFLSYYFKNIIIILVPCIGSVLTEICQLWFVPGTFDILDIAYILAATIIALFFIYRNKDERLFFKTNIK